MVHRGRWRCRKRWR